MPPRHALILKVLADDYHQCSDVPFHYAKHVPISVLLGLPTAEMVEGGNREGYREQRV